MVEGKIPASHREQHDPRAPYVRFERVVLVPEDHLRSRVARRPAGGLEPLLFLVEVAEPEVDELDVQLVIQQQVLGLEVPVHDLQRVDVLNALHYLLVELASFDLLQRFLLHDVVEELSLGRVLHH